MSNLAITYNLNGKDTTINFDVTQKTSVFKYKVCKAEGMQAETLEFYYKDNPLPERALKEIFGADNKPKIKILAIGVTPKDKKPRDGLSSAVGNRSDSTDVKNKTIYKSPHRQSIKADPKSFETSEPTIMNTVIVENFPSRQELMNMVNQFLDEKKYPKDFKTKNFANSVELLFSNIDVAFDFIKFFNFEKFKNKLYTKSNARLVTQTKMPKQRFNPENIKHDNLRKKPKLDYSPTIPFLVSVNLDDDGNTKAHPTDGHVVQSTTQKKTDTLKTQSVDKLHARKNKSTKLYMMPSEETHLFLNYSVPFICHKDIDKMTTTHKLNKEIIEFIHGKKEFVPYCQNGRKLDISQFYPSMFESKYEQHPPHYRELDKEKWIEPEHDFKITVMGKKKLY